MESRDDPRDYSVAMPISQDACKPDRLATLSLEMINFGNVPVHTVLRQIAVIQNNSVTERIAFKWCYPASWPKNSEFVFI